MFVTISISTVFAYGPDEMLGVVNHQASLKADGNVVKSTTRIVGAIITIARIITAAVAIVMIIVLAMKYMTSAPGDRATIKKHAVVYIVGAVIMFACTGILGIIQQFASSLGNA
jgi:hypothetical protein